MDFKGVKEIIEEVNSSEISYFEYKTNDGHIKMDKSLTRSIGGEVAEEKKASPLKITEEEEVIVSNTITKEEVQVINSVSSEEDDNLLVVKSPMVGTFYKSSSQESEPYVSEGKIVTKGDTLCIIEAMKLMNEIESDYTGTIIKVLVKDGDMVEYGEPLFKIKED